MGHKKNVAFVILLLSFLFFARIAIAQEGFHQVSGTVLDAVSGEAVVGANVYTDDYLYGAVTALDGSYELLLPSGSYIIVVSYMGYEKQQKKVELVSSFQFSPRIRPLNFETDEVVVSSEAPDRNVTDVESGSLSMRAEEVKRLPSFMGEPDPVKAISLSPGVAQTEGVSGIAVRGSGNSQNLVLLDNALIYNASHLLGIYSVFNADAMQGMTFIKSGIPAQYGGRLSSVLDVKTFGGNYDRYQLMGNIGLLSSNLTARAPLVKKKLWFSISARRTYLEYLLAAFSGRFITEGQKKNETMYYFGDINAKLEWQASTKDRVSLASYFGKDNFFFDNKRNAYLTIDWGNAAVSLEWVHIFSKRVKMSVNQNLSAYDFRFAADQAFFNMQLNTTVFNLKHNSDIVLKQKGRNELSFGFEHIYYKLRPNDISASIRGDELELGEAVDMHAHECSFYLSQKIELTHRLLIEAGLRNSVFLHTGPFDKITKVLYYYDTLSFKKRDVVAQYFSSDPRLSARYQLADDMSLKASYTLTHQYLHHASLSSASLPADVWLPSTDGVEPMKMHHASLGVFKNFKDNLFESSVNAYFKYLLNVADMNDGITSLNKTANIADNMLFGNADAMGVEFMLEKNKGHFKGTFAYTFSRSLYYIENTYGAEQYKSDFHRPHDLNIALSYEINPRLEVSALFSLASGKPLTLPSSRYFIEGNVVNEYAEKNGFAMPTYHRLDVSLKMNLNKTPRKFESDLLLSIYNVYNRQNPYFLYFETTGDLLNYQIDVKTKQVSLFSILPSVSWQFKF